MGQPQFGIMKNFWRWMVVMGAREILNAIELYT